MPCDAVAARPMRPSHVGRARAASPAPRLAGPDDAGSARSLSSLESAPLSSAPAAAASPSPPPATDTDTAVRHSSRSRTTSSDSSRSAADSSRAHRRRPPRSKRPAPSLNRSPRAARRRRTGVPNNRWRPGSCAQLSRKGDFCSGSETSNPRAASGVCGLEQDRLLTAGASAVSSRCDPNERRANRT